MVRSGRSTMPTSAKSQPRALEQRRGGGRPAQREVCELGRRIDVASLRQGLHPDQLAERAGLTRQTIHAIRTGITRSPSSRTICAIAEALGVTANDLLAGLF